MNLEREVLQILKEANKLPPRAYITRLDYERCPPGWVVRFTKKNEVLAYKFFRDSRYIDGYYESLYYAKEWRYWKFIELRTSGAIQKYCFRGDTIPPVFKETRSNNKSGKAGVRLCDNVYIRRNGSTIHDYSWSATWVEYIIIKGKVIKKNRCRKWSIFKWGFDEAKRLASQFRDEIETYLMSEKHQKIRDSRLQRK